MSNTMRSCVLVFFALAGTSAETSGCATEPGRFQACKAEVPTADTTSMLQLVAKSKAVTTRQHSKVITDPATCPLVSDAVWAAMDSYKYLQKGYPDYVANMYFPWAKTVKEDLQKAFWKQTARWPVVNKTTPAEIAAQPNMNDTDYSALFVKDGSCLMVFRGSDSQIDVNMLGDHAPDGYQDYPGDKRGAPNGVQWSDVEYHGLRVMLGVKVELEALLTKMQSDGGLAAMKETCISGLTLAGHSLGGGTSQLMATLLNKDGDPLGAGLTVDHVYGFGPMAFSKGAPAANDKRGDGCFAGGMYANAIGKTDAGIPKVDVVWEYLTGGLDFWHVKTSHHIMFSPTEEMVTPCGEDPPYPSTGRTVRLGMQAHDSGLYVANVGCEIVGGCAGTQFGCCPEGSWHPEKPKPGPNKPENTGCYYYDLE